MKELSLRAAGHTVNNINLSGILKIIFLLLIFGTFALTLFFLVYYERPFGRKTELINAPTSRQTTEGMERVACSFPKLSPFDVSILEHTKNGFQDFKCDMKLPKVFTTDLDTTLIRLRDLKEVGLENCCYRSFNRSSENEIKYSELCFLLNQTRTVIPESIEFFAVQCTTPKKSEKSSIIDVFGFTRLKADVENRVIRIEKEMAKKKASDQVNVVILGLDSISHMNFIRTMPLSHSFLVKNLSAIGMNGYTKVADSTFPNLVPVLSGLSLRELTAKCWSNSKVYFDACPFVWKNFSMGGYRTAYSEDAPKLGTFNYNRNGFLNPPTDYYLRTLTLAQDKEIGNAVGLCYGPRLGFQVLLKNLQSMAEKMGKDKRYFHLTWATSLSHDYLTAPTLGDRHLLATLRWLRESEHLNQSVLVVMSDHGMRTGGIRSTFQGQVEERMPFLFFVFPPWFSRKYGNAVRNLKTNRDKLTSPFDLYQTLLDLLDLSNLKDKEIDSRSQKLRTSFPMPRGISHFLPIPASRTCPLAGIDEHWCVCNEMEPISLRVDAVKESAVLAVQEINRLLSPHHACAVLTLNEIVSAKALKTRSYIKTNHSVITVVLSTFPGNALFEATVTKSGKRARKVSGDISRINLYGEQSWCVKDYILKKFCYCLKQL